MLSRRSLLQGSVATAVGLMYSRPMMTRLPLHYAYRAEKFCRGWGVNTHSSFGTGTYSNTQELIEVIRDLDPRIVRDRIIPGNAKQRAFFHAISPNCQVHSPIGVFNTTDQQYVIDARDEIINEYGGYTLGVLGVFRSVEGVNEPNDSPKPSNWAQIAYQQQQWIHNVLASRLATMDIPIVGPALKDAEPTIAQDFVDLGATGIVNLVDYGNFHRYPGGGLPTNLLNERMSQAEGAFPGLADYCTEGGYNTGVNSTSGGNPVTQLAQSIYVLRHHAEMFRRGVTAFFDYELLNDPDTTQWESNFGLYMTPSATDVSKWSPKPAFTALKRWLSLLGDRGPAFVPVGLRYTLTQHSDLRDMASLLLQKRDGRWFLLVWRDVKVCEQGRPPKDLNVTPTDIELDFGARSRSVKIYRPSISSNPVDSWDSVANLTFPLEGEMFVLEIV